jgi:hypothetical protein
MISAFRDIGAELGKPSKQGHRLPASERPSVPKVGRHHPVLLKIRESIAESIVVVGLAVVVGALAAICHNRAMVHSTQVRAGSLQHNADGMIREHAAASRGTSAEEPVPKSASLPSGPPYWTGDADAMQLTSFFETAKEPKWTQSLEWQETALRPENAGRVVVLPETDKHTPSRASVLKSPIRRLAAVPSADAGPNSAIHLPVIPASDPSQSPTTAARPEEIAAPQPAPGIDVRPVRSMKIDIRAPGGAVPDNLAREQLSRRQSPGDTVSVREWSPFAYRWEAPGLCHQPLYFEEVSLERLGRSPVGPRFAQPVISAAHFFGTIPLLPYAIATDPPSELVYTLGEYRPGSNVPYDLRRPQFSLRGLAAQSAAVTGLILMIP